MPYRSRRDLPASVQATLKHVPRAQELYREVFNTAYLKYAASTMRLQGRNREETAHAVAWNAVRKYYEVGADGKWHQKPDRRM
ncbi:MAG TPA: ChaB family protein [Candidatus Paceibacterota bacterium]